MIINRAVKSAYMMHFWSRLFTVSHIEVNRFDPHTAVSRVSLSLRRVGITSRPTRKTRCAARHYKRLGFHKTST